MKLALEQQLRTGSVAVDRGIADRNGGVIWTIGFDEMPGDVDEIVAESQLTGLGAQIRVSESHKGTARELQQFEIAAAAASNITGEFVLSIPAFGGNPEARSGIIVVSDASKPDELKSLIQEALENSISGAAFGSVTVACEGTPDLGFVFNVTFLTKSGDLPQVELLDAMDVLSGSVGLSGHDSAGTSAATIIEGTSFALGGSFALTYRGERTSYMPYNASSAILAAELEELTTIYDISVQRSLMNENGGYTWTVTFEENLGDLPLLEADASSLSGTMALAVVEEVVQGQPPPFDQGQGGLPLGAQVIADVQVDELIV